MKNLAKLNGAKALSKNEQKSINGGKSVPNDGLVCPDGEVICYFTGNNGSIYGGGIQFCCLEDLS